MSINYTISYPGTFTGTVLDRNNNQTGFKYVAPHGATGGSAYTQADLEVFSNYLAIRPRFGRTGGTATITNLLQNDIARLPFTATIKLSRANLLAYNAINSTALGVYLGRHSQQYLRVNIEKVSSGWGYRLALRYTTAGGTAIGNVNMVEGLIETLLADASNTFIYVDLSYNFSTGVCKGAIRGSSTGVIETASIDLKTNYQEFVNLMNSDTPTPPYVGLAGYNFSDPSYTGNGHPWYQFHEFSVVYDYVTLNSATVSPLSQTSGGTVENLGTPLYRINVGSTTASLGWQQDQYFPASGTATITRNAQTVQGTANNAMYQTERYPSAAGGSMTYTLPNISVSSVNIILRFSENFHTAAGQRRFDVSANGAVLETGLDIFALAKGQYRAVDRVYRNVPMSGSNLTITLASNGQPSRPFLMGIDVYSPPVNSNSSIFNSSTVSPLSASTATLTTFSRISLTSATVSPLSISSGFVSVSGNIHLTPQLHNIRNATSGSMGVSGSITMNGSLTSPLSTVSGTLITVGGTTVTGAGTIPAPVSESSMVSSGIVTLNANINSALITQLESSSILVRGSSILNGAISSKILGVSQITISPEIFVPSNDVDITYDNSTNYEIIFNVTKL